MKTAEELQKELDDTKLQNEASIKALQQKLTDKDLETKKILAEVEELKGKKPEDSETQKQIQTLTETVTKLTEQIGETKTNERKSELAKKYPDIDPDLLIGKTDEECDNLATKQRARMEETYGKRPSDHEPLYKDRDSIDAEIERITSDKTMRSEDKMVAVRELKLRKGEL